MTTATTIRESPPLSIAVKQADRVYALRAPPNTVTRVLSGPARAVPRASALCLAAVTLPAALTLACGGMGTTHAKTSQATPAETPPANPPTEPEIPPHPAIQFNERTRLRPLTRTEGQRIIVEHDDFIRRLSPLDRQLRLHTRDPVDTATFLEHAKAQVLEWTPQYLRLLRGAVEIVQQRLQEAEIDLDLPPEITVVITTGLEEGMHRPVAYVRGTSIFLNRMALAVDLPHTLAHELLHLYTGTHADKQAQLYKLIGFDKEPDFRLPADLEARRITNPDEMYFEHKVEVEHQAKKYWVIPVLLATGPYREGDFFDHLDLRWATIEHAPPLMLRTEELEGLHAKIGHNTTYVLGPEEVIAENFALAIERRELPTPDIAVGVLDIIRGRNKPRPSAQEVAATSDTEVRETFEAWLDAQNRGDFRAYSALYSQDFVGLEQDTFTYRRDREGWLFDRKPMFEHPMTVKARELVVTVRGNAAMIYFTQHQGSESSQDMAPRRIEMVRERGRWRISSEVRLRPNLLRSPSDEELALVGDLAEPYAMLDVVDRQGLRHGERTLEHNRLGYSVIATIPKGRAPAHAKRWVGRDVRVITDKEKLCTGRIEHLRYIARVMPHHAESRYFQGLVNDRGEEVQPPRPVPDAQILEAIWQSTHSIFVGARIALDGHCAGEPLVALPASATVPRVAKPLDATPRVQAVVAAFRALPEYAREQKACVAQKQCAAGKSWEQRPLTVQAFQFQGGTEALASVAHSSMGCGSYYVQNLWTVFDVPLADEKAPLVSRKKPTTAAPYWIELVLDRSGSGELEYVANDGNGGLVLIDADGKLLQRWAADFQCLEC